MLLRQWIIFYCISLQYIAYCIILTNTFETLLLKSSLTLSGYYKYPIILTYELRLQTNPTKNQLNGCMKHHLSSPIIDDYFILTLGKRSDGTSQFRNFTNNNISLNIANGGPIPVGLTFGKNEKNLWTNFTLNYKNFEPIIKYNNGTDVNIPECHVIKDAKILCIYHSNSVLNCSDDNFSSSTVSPPLSGHTSTTLGRSSTITVSNTMSTSGVTAYPSTSIMSTTATNNHIGSSPSSSSSTTLLPPNPIIINCTDPITALNDIYCDLSTNEIIPTSGNISTITNATLHAINATKMSPEEIYAVAYILEQCSLITNLTEMDFNGMAKLFDTIMLAPQKSYENANDYSNSANSLILTINRMMTNSPSNVKYLNGRNIALLGKSLNCDSNNFDAGGITDLGDTFIENPSSKKFDASIFVNGEIVCESKATRVFYTIYRNSKFFVGEKDNGNGIISNYRINALKIPSSKLSSATTSKEVVNLSHSCKKGLLQTDDRVVSATILKGTQKGFENIHRFDVNGEEKIMVTIKYSEEHVSKFYLI
uniref:Uncharacterized protein n=1 Tax=Panagrolaimus davidi TaxID=227884 RepID=A0A914PRM0_9BILA